MSKGNDFARISDLFSLRSHFDDSSLDSSCIQFLNQIPKYDKNQYSNFSKCKSWGEFYNCLEKIKYNYAFDPNVINEILNMSLSFKEFNALIFFYQVLSFFYYHSQQKNKNDEDNFIKIVNAMICLNPYQTQAKQVYSDIYSFFANSIVLYFINYHRDFNKPSICCTETIKFYTSSAFIINVDFFIDFVNIAKDISTNSEESLLDLVLSNAQTNELSEKIIIFLQPLCEKFNEKALNCLSLLPPFPKIEQIMKDLAVQICENAGETKVKKYEEELNAPLQKDLKFNYETIETESHFSDGFKSYIEYCDNESEFLLRILNKTVRKKINAIESSFQFFSQNLVKLFLDVIVDKFESSSNEDEKVSLYIIFIVLCDKISKNSIVSDYSNFFFNSCIFNQNVTAFNKKKLDPTLETIRSLVFSIVSSNGNVDIDPKLSAITNPLFMAEFLSRIKNLKAYYNQFFIETVISTSLILRRIDIESHSQNIEKARSSLFLVMSNLFSEMDDSYKYFSQVMQFSYEKSVTSIFVFLFKSTLKTPERNHYEFEYVFNFINGSLDHNLEISWRFIEIVSSFFLKFKHCTELTTSVFDLLISYLSMCHEKNVDFHCYEALQFVFEFVGFYQKVPGFQLRLIGQFIQKFNSPELQNQLVLKIGNPESKMVGKEGFLIQNPIFLLIFALTYGFTNKVLKLFNDLIEFSLLNAAYFHRYKIDYIIVELLTKDDGKKFKSEGVDFEIQVDDKNKMKSLLFKIMKVNCDYSIVSSFLTNQALLPDLYYLFERSLNDPRPIVPLGFFQSNYSCKKLNSSIFQKTFTLSFWLLIDTFVEIQNIEINLISLKCRSNDTTLNIFLQKNQMKISLETKQNVTEVILRQNIFNQMKWRLFTIIFDSDSFLISTYIDNSDMNQSQFVPITFQSNSTVRLSVGGSTSAKFHHQICGYIGTISLFNRALNQSEIEHLTFFKSSTRTFDSSSIIVSSIIPGDFVYSKRSYTNETLLSTLCNPNTVNKIFQLLFEEEDEKVCYYYLSLIDSLAFVIPIEISPIYHFVTLEKCYQFKKLYKIIFSIFSHIPQARENDDANDKESSISASNSAVLNEAFHKNNLNLNLNLIKPKSSKQEVSLQQKWFKNIIINLDIWINYSNFDEILYFWNDTLLIRYQNFFKEGSFISSFLNKIELFEQRKLSPYHWDQFFLFLERLAYINMNQDEEKILFQMISELILKFNKIMTNEAYLKNTQKYCTASNELRRTVLPQSNLESMCIDVFGNDEIVKQPSEGSKVKKWKDKIKKHFHRRLHRRRKSSRNLQDGQTLATSMSLDHDIGAIDSDLSSSSLNEEESDDSSSFENVVEYSDDNQNDDNNNNNNNDDDDIESDNENTNSNNNISSNSNSNNSNNNNNSNSNSNSNNNNNNDNDNNNDNNNNNDNDDNNNNNEISDDNENDGDDDMNENENESGSGGGKKKKKKFLSKLNFFAKLPYFKRKSLEYDKKYFKSMNIGFSSQDELEKETNTLIYLLQLSQFSSYAKNSKNNQTNIDDDDNDNVNDDNSANISSSNSSSMIVATAQNNPHDEKRMPDLVRQLYTVLQKESSQFNVIFSALRIKDSTIICEALFGIHEIIPHTSVLKYTAESLRIIDPRMYEGVIQYLSKQIHLYPYLFPLLCALILFASKDKSKGKKRRRSSRMATIFNDEEFISNLNEVVINDYFEKWLFFPIVLSFFVEERFAKEQILAVIARSVNGNWDAIVTSISLITYIQDFFKSSNDDSLLIFYMLLTNFNPDNKNLGDIFVQICYSLFFVATPTKPKFVPFQFNNIDDVLIFVNQSCSSFDVRFFVRLEDEAIFQKGLNDLALNQINDAVNHFRVYPQDYIKNVRVILSTISLDFKPQSADNYASMCKFIEKMRKDYKEQYSKQIHSILETIKRSLNSKAFHDFTNEKFVTSIANSKSPTFSPSDENLNQENQPSISTQNSIFSGQNIDHFSQYNLKRKRSVDLEYRQGILEQISAANKEEKIELKEDNINCHIYKEEGDEAIPASFELKHGIISIKTDSKSFKIDCKDIYGFKRENLTIEYITNEGKSFFITFNDTEANKILRSKMTKKKIISRKVTQKLLDDHINNWRDYRITTFQLLMFINFYKGRTQKSILNACFPSMLSKDVNKSDNNDQIYEFSNNMKIDDMSFDVDFAGESSSSNRMINQLKSKNVVSAELYYFFESISQKQLIPKEFANDRFEFVYNLRKMIENINNIEVWVEKVFNITIQSRPIFYKSQSAPQKEYLLFSNQDIKIKFAAQIRDIDSFNRFIVCSTEGYLFVTNKETKDTSDQSVEFSADAQFFSLADGVIIYSNKLHNLIAVDKYGNTNIIKNIFIDPSIVLFAGSINRLVYLSTPTRINLVRDLTFKGSLSQQVHSDKRKILPSYKSKSTTVKLDIEGNQQIHQIPSCVKILKVSLNFNIIAIFSQDTYVRLITLYDGKLINEFSLNGKIALELLITDSFGFVFIATKSKAYLLTNNGTLIRKVHFDFQKIVHWFKFTTRDGIDYIGMVKNDGENNTIMYFEAFYLDKINEELVTLNGVPNLLSISFDPLSEEFTLFDQNGKVTTVTSPPFK